jgi:hypothetical protein
MGTETFWFWVLVRKQVKVERLDPKPLIPRSDEDLTANWR